MKELIEKYNLQQQYDQSIGQSFLYNRTICYWPEISDENTRVMIMDCDKEGLPLEDNKYMIYAIDGRHGAKLWCSFIVPHGFMMDIPQAKSFVKLKLEEVMKVLHQLI